MTGRENLPHHRLQLPPLAVRGTDHGSGSESAPPHRRTRGGSTPESRHTGRLSARRFRAGQPVLAIEETGKRWLSFNAREDFLHGLTVGMKVEVERSGSRAATPAVVTELLPLGPFAAWQAERAVGDYDLNTLRLRLDPQADASAFEPGMTVWFYR